MRTGIYSDCDQAVRIILKPKKPYNSYFLSIKVSVGIIFSSGGIFLFPCCTICSNEGSFRNKMRMASRSRVVQISAMTYCLSNFQFATHKMHGFVNCKTIQVVMELHVKDYKHSLNECETLTHFMPWSNSLSVNFQSRNFADNFPFDCMEFLWKFTVDNVMSLD